MTQTKFNDLGLGTKAQRLVNKDGSFNVKRRGEKLNTLNLYQFMIKMPWVQFFILIAFSLLFINTFFAFLYFQIGIENFNGLHPEGPLKNFLNCLYFSFQTFTTVGYGHISPKAGSISILAALEAVTGLTLFAVTTGLLYGRFSKPSAKFIFSDSMLVSPFQEGWSIQFRIVNKRKSIIMHLHARLLVSFSTKNHTRKYIPLELERNSVVLFPLNWTIVHPLTPNSPLYHKTRESLAELDAEFIIVLKGYDETFSQEVHTIYSYHHDEIIWGANFNPMYEPGTGGHTLLNMNKISSYSLVQTDPENKTNPF